MSDSLPFHFLKEGMTSFVIGDKAYINSFFNNNDFYEFDPANNTWIVKENYPFSNMYSYVSFAINGKGYLGLGFGQDENDDYVNLRRLYEYNPITNTWLRKTDFPGAPRSNGVAFVIGKYAYFGMGNMRGKWMKDFWRYDPVQDEWTQVDSCGYAAEGCWSFVLNGKAYVGGGFWVGHNVWQYTPESTNLDNVAACCGVAIYPNPANDKVYVTFESGDVAEVEFYDMQGRNIFVPSNGDSYSLSHLKNGCYLLKIEAGQKVFTQKIIKQ